MTNELSPRARAFLRATRFEHDPTPNDAERVHAQLMARIAAGTTVAAGTVLMARQGAFKSLLKALAGLAHSASSSAGATVGATALVATKAAAVVTVVGAVAVGTTLAVAHRAAPRSVEAPVHARVGAGAARPPAAPAGKPPAPPPTSEPAILPRSAPEPADPTHTDAPAVGAATRAAEGAPPTSARGSELRGGAAPTSSRPLSSRPPSARRSGDTASAGTARSAPVPSSPPATAADRDDLLDREVELIRQAHDALRDGEPGFALAILDDHERRFPRGALAQDRDAQRVLALCALGRLEEARTAAARFLSGYPLSPHAPAVRDSCAAAAGE
jgi:hypothetical protein